MESSIKIENITNLLKVSNEIVILIIILHLKLNWKINLHLIMVFYIVTMRLIAALFEYDK